MGSKSKSKILSLLLIILFSYMTLEVGTCVLMKENVLPGDIPSFSFAHIGPRFWQDLNPDFGVWHLPNTSFRHRKSCFDVVYQSNPEGMRDRPRERNGEKSRILMIGDSFIEGWGVEEPDRLSNLLEKAWGKEALNFGTSGYFGPTQYYLLYKTLAKHFTHDEVIVGILPSNDFNDDDYERWKDKGRHRPFWVGEYPHYRLSYPESVSEGMSWKRYLGGFFREFSYLYNAVKFVFLSRKMGDHVSGDKIFSRFYDFDEAEFNRMAYSLELLRSETEGKRLTILLIPILNDIKRYDQEGKSPLAQRLVALGKEKNFDVFDLTPWFHRNKNDWAQYYFSCDNHWSPRGNQAALEFLEMNH
jgi:lysophospholipase L1-like esterase